jgi:arylsulfatase A-like enzyme
VIPRTSATLPKVLGAYGYNTAAFGKWHNTLATETTAMGPFALWPTGEAIGFDYFYGFLAGETSQWECGDDGSADSREIHDALHLVEIGSRADSGSKRA